MDKTAGGSAREHPAILPWPLAIRSRPNCATAPCHRDVGNAPRRPHAAASRRRRRGGVPPARRYVIRGERVPDPPAWSAAQAETLDQRAIALLIDPLHIVKQAAALGNQLQEATA